MGLLYVGFKTGVFVGLFRHGYWESGWRSRDGDRDMGEIIQVGFWVDATDFLYSKMSKRNTFSYNWTTTADVVYEDLHPYMQAR